MDLLAIFCDAGSKLATAAIAVKCDNTWCNIFSLNKYKTMTPTQKAIVDKAKKTTIKKEPFLGGSAKYSNQIRKQAIAAAKTKKRK